ncbi:MAG TPA: hypothetical protein VKV57_06260 [bacterium]|nr:hypothetical protein [bacterium]
MSLGTPNWQAFTPKERKVVRAHRTPRQVQALVRSVPYNWERHGETLRTFRGVVRHWEAHCLEALLTAAMILERYGYPPLVVDLESQDDLDHELFVFRRGRRWGAVASSRDPGLFGRPPVFRTIRDLVMSYVDPYVNETGRIVGYGLGDLTELVRCDWRLSRHNVWEVERALIKMPHRRLRTSDQRHRRMHAEYLSFKEQKRTFTPRGLRDLYGPSTALWW